jgi:hypothetical protein
LHSIGSFPFPTAQQSPGGQGLFIIQASRLHSDTTFGRNPLDDRSDRPGDLYLYKTQLSQEADINSHGGIRTRNPSKREAADPRPGGHGRRLLAHSSGVPRNFFRGGGGVQQIQLRTENGDLGAVAPKSGVLEAAVIWYKKFHFI